MSKRNTTLLLVALALSALWACSEDESPAATRVAVADVEHGELDLAPSELFERAAADEVAMTVDSVSMPLSAREALQPFEAPEPLEFKETTFLVEPGSDAGELLLPVDAAEGARIYIASKAQGTLEEQRVLNREVIDDIRVYDPSRERVLNVRADRNRVGGTTTPEGGLEAPTQPAPTDGSAGDVTGGTGGTTFVTPGADDIREVLGERALGSVALEDGAGAGNYVLVFGERAAQIGFAVEVRLPESAVELTMAPSADQILLGGEGTVRATLTNAGAPQDATVEAHLVLPDGSKGGEVPLRAAGAGRWEADVNAVMGPDSPAGAYNVYVRATGTIDGQRFDRYGWTGFHFAVPTARVVAASSPTIVREGGKITELQIPVELEVRSADRYELTGTLVHVSESGTVRPLARAQTGAGLATGDATITLTFDAGHVALAELDGQYELRHLTLYAQSQHATFSRELGGLGLKTESLNTDDMAEAELTPAMEVLLEEGMLGH